MVDNTIMLVQGNDVRMQPRHLSSGIAYVNLAILKPIQVNLTEEVQVQRCPFGVIHKEHMCVYISATVRQARAASLSSLVSLSKSLFSLSVSGSGSGSGSGLGMGSGLALGLV